MHSNPDGPCVAYSGPGALRALLVALACALALAPGVASAQDEDQPSVKTRAEEDELFELDRNEDSVGLDDAAVGDDERAEGEDIGVMKRSELESIGFDFGDRARAQRQSTATILALSAGAFAHGVGHWYLGDVKTAWVLATGEGISLALLAAGVMLPSFFGDDASVASISRHLTYAGTGLFGATWAMDVAGTLSGAVLPNTNRLDRVRGASLAARYGYLEPARYLLNNALYAELDLNFDAVRVMGTTLQEFNLRHSTYGAALRWVPLRVARTPLTWLGVEATGELLQFRETGRFDRWSAGAVVTGELDMATFSASLRQLVVGGRFGWERQFVFLPGPQVDFGPGAEPSALAFSYAQDTFPFAIWLHTDVAPQLNARIAYERRDGAVLQDVERVWGVPSATLTYRSSNKLDLEFRIEYGSGPGVWGGLRAWIWR